MLKANEEVGSWPLAQFNFKMLIYHLRRETRSIGTCTTITIFITTQLPPSSSRIRFLHFISTCSFLVVLVLQLLVVLHSDASVAMIVPHETSASRKQHLWTQSALITGILSLLLRTILFAWACLGFVRGDGSHLTAHLLLCSSSPASVYSRCRKNLQASKPPLPRNCFGFQHSNDLLREAFPDSSRLIHEPLISTVCYISLVKSRFTIGSFFQCFVC